MRNFLNFIREQGVVGLAVGFILGGAISKVVTSLVTDVINPLLSIILGFAGELKDAYFLLAGTEIKWGSFLAAIIDFAVIAAVVYFGVHILKLDRLDKKKDQ